MNGDGLGLTGAVTAIFGLERGFGRPFGVEYDDVVCAVDRDSAIERTGAGQEDGGGGVSLELAGQVIALFGLDAVDADVADAQAFEFALDDAIDSFATFHVQTATIRLAYPRCRKIRPLPGSVSGA